MAKHGNRKHRTRPDCNERLWSHHHGQWREPSQVVAQWNGADVDPVLLKSRATSGWWDLLAKFGLTLLVSREYEHLVLALSTKDGRPHLTYLAMPHPSGIAVDRDTHTVHVASTRNPNQIYDFTMAVGADQSDPQLIALRSRFFPGQLYMHDLAVMSGELYANAVGHNAIAKIRPDASYELVWWPKCVDTNPHPTLDRNYIQMNSIAANGTLADSFFSASSDSISARRPGHKNYPVDRRGVIFSGATGEVVARGLTRPHSARLKDNRLFVDNSGYGEVTEVDVETGNLTPICRLPGWTRGLCILGDIAFVGTSRVIPRFAQYAPGLDVNSSKSGIHAVDIQSGRVLESIVWPSGNQIFAIEWLPDTVTRGFAFQSMRHSSNQTKQFFYAFQTATQVGGDRT